MNRRTNCISSNSTFSRDTVARGNNKYKNQFHTFRAATERDTVSCVEGQVTEALEQTAAQKKKNGLAGAAQ